MLIFFAIGMTHTVIRIIGWDFSSIPGDLGDSRFNLFILEHGYRFITGQIGSFWEGQYLFPAEKVVAYSDNLIGAMPFYAIFRFVGFDQHTAYQFWFILMFGLNYLCCYYAFKKLFGFGLIATLAAYIFAFGLFNIGQIYHAQLFPRFAIPLILFSYYRFLQNPQFRYLAFSFALLTYQFLCGVYLGFFAFYGLLIISISHILMYWRDLNPKLVFISLKQSSWKYYLLLIISLAAMIWLFLPYLEVANQFGMRAFDTIEASIPRIRSYFFTSQASTIWYEIFFTHTSDKMELWWTHFLFPGLTPYLIMLLGIPLIILQPKGKGMKKLYFYGLSMLLAIFFSTHFGSFTPYEWVYKLPGFSSMRAINRIINVNVVFILFFAASILNTYQKVKPRFVTLSLIFLLFVPYDNSFDMNWDVKRFSKIESREKIDRVKQKIQDQLQNSKNAVAVKLPLQGMSHDQVINHHITVMLACQELGITCINGYSGNYPPNYMTFFDHVDESSLKKWLENKSLTVDQVQMIEL